MNRKLLCLIVICIVPAGLYSQEPKENAAFDKLRALTS